MKVQTEIYKGIEFIQISKLPEDQKLLIKQSIPADQIIKILKENELLTDCIQFQHYSAWYDGQFLNPTKPKALVVAAEAQEKSVRLA